MLLLLVTFLAYANALHDNLVWDDTRFALTERFSGLGLADIGRFFREDLWAVEAHSSGLYRPMLLLSVMLDVRLLGDWVAGYHLVNIILHVLTTGLVYGFIRQFLLACGTQPSSSRIAALLAALIFGVHPIHAEVVNSIFNRSEILVSMGVAGGLWWLLRNHEHKPNMAWCGLGLIYLLVLFCRESGVTLPVLAVAMLWLTTQGGWRRRLRACFPVVLLVIPLGIYLFMRAGALQTTAIADQQNIMAAKLPVQTEQFEEVTTDPNPEEEAPGTKVPAGNPARVSSDDGRRGGLAKLFAVVGNFHPERFPAMVRMWADALRLMAWPHPLVLFHGAPDIGFLAAMMTHLVLLGAAMAGYFLKRPGLLMGLSFFYISLLPSSSLFTMGTSFELSERFLYLPSLGLTLCLAYLLAWMVKRLDSRAVILPVVIIMAILTPVTWARNSEWTTNLGLAEADYMRGSNHFYVLTALVEGYLDAGNYTRAAQTCDSHPAKVQDKRTLGNLCATVYDLAGRSGEAEGLLLQFVEAGRAKSFMYFTLAGIYLRHGRRSEAQRQFERGIATEQVPSHRELLTGIMLARLHPHDREKLLEAREHYLEAIELQPQFFQARQALNELDKTLGININ